MHILLERLPKNSVVSLNERLNSDMVIVVDWDIIPQQTGSHHVSWLNYNSYKSMSSILNNKLSWASFL